MTLACVRVASASLRLVGVVVVRVVLAVLVVVADQVVGFFFRVTGKFLALVRDIAGHGLAATQQLVQETHRCSPFVEGEDQQYRPQPAGLTTR